MSTPSKDMHDYTDLMEDTAMHDSDDDFKPLENSKDTTTSKEKRMWFFLLAI